MDRKTSNVVIWDNVVSLNEIWKFVWNDTKQAYQIKSSFNNSVLTWDSQKGNNVIGFTENFNYDNQFWRLEKTNDDYYYISNLLDSDKLLTVSSGSIANGLNIEVNTRTNSIRQQFKIHYKQVDHIIEGAYAISPNTNTNKNLHLDTKTSNIVLWDDVNNANDRWVFNYIKSKGAYVISSTAEANVLAWDKNKGNNVFYTNYNHNYDDQHWLLEKNSDGTYYFKNLFNSNKVLTFNGLTNGSNIVVEDLNLNSNNQKIVIHKKQDNRLKLPQVVRLGGAEHPGGSGYHDVNQNIRNTGFGKYMIGLGYSNSSNGLKYPGYIADTTAENFYVNIGFFNVNGKTYCSDVRTGESLTGKKSLEIEILSSMMILMTHI